MTDVLKAGALFSGIGGFCLGFQKHGIKTAWAVENDPAAVATYQRNIPGVRIISDKNGPASIVNVTVAGNKLEPVDVLHAGFPCQSFSAAGERKGFEDPRGTFFESVTRMAWKHRVGYCPFSVKKASR